MLNPLMELRTEVKSVDKDEKLVEHLKRLYVSCRTHYVVSRPGQRFYVPKRNGAFCPLTDMALLKHLQHEYAVGIYAGDNGSRFICFDMDDGNADTVRRVIAELEALGIPPDRIYVSFSGRKGYHVEVFFDTVVETGRLRCGRERQRGEQQYAEEFLQNPNTCSAERRRSCGGRAP